MAGDSSISILRSSFERCSSTNRGGAIQAKDFTDLRILESNFTSNGGEIGSDISASDSASSIEIKNSRFARSTGNPIRITNAGIQIESSHFSEFRLSPYKSVFENSHATEV